MYQIPSKRDCSVVYPQKVVWVSTRTRDFKRNEQRLKYQGHVSQAFQTYGRQPRKRGAGDVTYLPRNLGTQSTADDVIFRHHQPSTTPMCADWWRCFWSAQMFHVSMPPCLHVLLQTTWWTTVGTRRHRTEQVAVSSCQWEPRCQPSKSSNETTYLPR